MRKITNRDYAKVDNAVNNLIGTIESIEEFGSSLKSEIEALIANHKDHKGKALSDYMEDLDEAKDSVRQLVEEVISNIDDYTSERSEKWHDSEVADDTLSWRGEWEELLVTMDKEIVKVEVVEPFQVEVEDEVEIPSQELY